MTKVNSNTEWGELKEVILGIVNNAQIPRTKKHDIHCVDYANYPSVSRMPEGPYPQQVLDETKEDLDIFQAQLTGLGIQVLRPDPVDHSLLTATPNWTSDGYYLYCPRDSVLVINDTIIETPMPLRSRYFETLGFKKIFKDYFMSGSKWISAPKPELSDELYNRTDLSKPTLTDYEIAFDAANVVKCGKDIFYLVSNSGNRLGAKWLQSMLGEKYTIHVLDNIYAYVHIDTTIMPLAPGKVLLNPSRVNENNLPEYFKKWDKIWAAEPVATPYLENWAPASPWLGMNVLSLSERLVAVEQSQTPLIRQLESKGFDVLQVQMRHCRTLSGGPHCVTLDTIRKDVYDDYG
jgi:N-dimethylarginine dimethylaminohydrolase